MVSDDKNGGPNFVREWRMHRGMSQAELAEKVGTNANMIGYLESGERGLNAKWLRRLSVALDTTAGNLLDKLPSEVEDEAEKEVPDFWDHASKRQRKQIAAMAKAFLATSPNH